MKRQNNFKMLMMTGALSMMLVACGKENNNGGNNVVITPDNQLQGTVGDSTNTPEDTTISGNNALEFKNDVAVADVEAAVASALGDNYWPTENFESLESLEITKDMYEEFIYRVPMMNTNVDTLIIVKAAEGKVAEVENKLNTFRDNNVNDLMQYPSNLVKIQCSQVVTMGNYVAYVQLGADEAYNATANLPANTSDDDLAKAEMEAVEAHNELAISAMKAVLAK